MVELELGAVDFGHVPADPVVATDDEVEERAEDDAEDHLAPQRRPVAVAGLGIEIAFVALPGAVALVVVMVRRIFHWRTIACASVLALTLPRQIIDARGQRGSDCRA